MAVSEGDVIAFGGSKVVQIADGQAQQCDNPHTFVIDGLEELLSASQPHSRAGSTQRLTDPEAETLSQPSSAEEQQQQQQQPAAALAAGDVADAPPHHHPRKILKQPKHLLCSWRAALSRSKNSSQALQHRQHPHMVALVLACLLACQLQMRAHWREAL